MATSPNVGLIAAFGAGMVSFLSPCVLPLVPGYLSLMSGLAVSDVQTPTGAQRGRLVRSALLFVGGFSVVFAMLGASASAIGGVVDDHHTVLLRIAGVVTIVMGLFMAGIFRPLWLLRERRIYVSPARLGPIAAPVMGAAFAFGWTPCIGAVLAPIITLASSSRTVGRGTLLLVTYSLGLGVPFVLTALGLDRLSGAFGWWKRHARAIDLVSGLMLSAFGFLLLTDQLTRISTTILTLMDRVGLDPLSRI